MHQAGHSKHCSIADHALQTAVPQFLTAPPGLRVQRQMPPCPRTSAGSASRSRRQAAKATYCEGSFSSTSKGLSSIVLGLTS